VMPFVVVCVAVCCSAGCGSSGVSGVFSAFFSKSDADPL